MFKFGFDVLRKRSFDVGSTPPFDISDLGLTLDLRAPLEVLTAETSRYNSSIVTECPGFISDIDTTVMLDRHLDLATGSAQYSSNFSLGVDSFAETNCVIQAVDGVAGEDDWLEIKTDGSELNIKSITRAATLTVGVVYEITLRVNNPIGNLNTNGLLIGDISGKWVTINDDELPSDGVTREFTFRHYATSTGFSIVFSSFFEEVVEQVYIKDIVISPVSGFHSIQATAAAMPHNIDSDFTIYGDGTDDKMTINDIAAWKTAVSGDTAGMFGLKFFDIAGAGVETRLEGFGNAAGVGYFQIMRILHTNVLQVTISNGAAVNTLTYDVTALRGGWIDVFVGSDGSNYHLWVNGSLVAHTEVLNFADGSWINSLAAATWHGFYLFQNRVGTSFPLKLRALNYKSGRVYTPTEIANIRATPLYTT